MGLNFGQSNLDALFPFFVAIDQKGLVVSFGRSAPKCFKGIVQGNPYSEYFTVSLPKGFDPVASPDLWTKKITTLKSLSTQISFNGETLWSENNRCYVFAVSPLIKDMDLLTQYNLTYSDFATYSPFFDFYILTQAERFARSEQVKAFHSLEEQYQYSKLNLEIANFCSKSEHFPKAIEFALESVKKMKGWEGQLQEGSLEISKDQIQVPLKLDGIVRYTLIFHNPENVPLTESTKLFLASLAHTLENLIQRLDRERTIQEAQATKVNSSKMYMLGEMAAGIAHELNNPMAVIQGITQITLTSLESTDLSKDKIKDNMNKILKMTERSTKIIKGLRVFSRDAKDDPMELMDLRKVIEDTLDLCGSRIMSKGIELRWVPKDGFFSRGRPIQISQVILNLLNNASDAVESDAEPWIEISIEKWKGKWKLSVTDSGKGISSEVVEKMMAPFFTTKAPGKGTGLGLSISRSIILNHGGEFWYESQLSNTRFSFTLPVFDS